MRIIYIRHSLKFKNKLVRNQHVYSVLFIKLFTFKEDIDQFLSVCVITSVDEFFLDTGFINFFAEIWPHKFVHFNTRAYGFIRQPFIENISDNQPSLINK